MTVDCVRDENLRLILSEQEANHIEERENYYRGSLKLCAYILGSALVYLLLYPFLMVISSELMVYWFVIALIFAILSLGASLMFFVTYAQFQKYKRYKREHRKFLQKYQRI